MSTRQQLDLSNYHRQTQNGLWVLVTASRTWPEEHKDTIWTALDECLIWAELHKTHLTVMHGGARGGDGMAHHWTIRAARTRKQVNAPLVRKARWRDDCREDCWPEHRKPVEGTPTLTVCPMAGYHRNEDMVNELVALNVTTLVLAFIHHPEKYPKGTKGATHCLNYAKAAKLDFVEFHIPPQKART